MTTPDFWTTDEGRKLHGRMAKLLSWPDSLRIPSPPFLIRQLEAGMTEEQLGRYAEALFNKITETTLIMVSGAGLGLRTVGKLITAPDETRGRAIVEVYAAKDQEK